MGIQSRRHFLSLMATTYLALAAGCGDENKPQESEDEDKAQESRPVPILLPAYFYDANLWQRALTPRTPAHKIITNVNDGPGEENLDHFQALFDQARSFGHQLIGYVATGYGKVSLERIIRQSLAWKQLYGIEHIFLDEVSDQASMTNHYKAIVQAIRHATPESTVILNPGTPPDESYFFIDPKIEIVVFESTWADFQKVSFPNWMNSWWTHAHVMVYNAPVDALASIYTFVSQRHASGFFISDAGDAIYHEALPSYWEQELAL